MRVSFTLNGKTYSFEQDGPLLDGPLSALGVPYTWGGGDVLDVAEHWPRGVMPKTSQPAARGYDCSGFVLAALIMEGILDPDKVKAKDLSSMGIANICDEVSGSILTGDVFIYNRHIMLYIGRGILLGATGGGHEDFGLNPAARVQAVNVLYRVRDFICVGRLKNDYRC